MLFYFADFFFPHSEWTFKLGAKPFSGSFNNCLGNHVLNWWITLTRSPPVLQSDYDDSTCRWQTDFWPSGYFFPLSSSSVFLFGFWDFVVFLFFPLYCLELTLHTACPPPSLHPPLLYLIKFFFKLSFPALGLTTGSHQSRNWVLKLQQLSQLAHLLMFGFSDVSS